MGMCGTGERVLGSENGQADNLLSGSLVVQRSDVAESHRDSTLSPYGNPKSELSEALLESQCSHS